MQKVGQHPLLSLEILQQMAHNVQWAKQPWDFLSHHGISNILVMHALEQSDHA
jgi:hypothetical protein